LNVVLKETGLAADTPSLLALRIRRRGSNVIFLGANVPTTRFAEAIKKVKADRVILVAQQLTSAATLQQSALALSNQNIHIAFGGRIISLLRRPAQIHLK